jgi:predicted DNA-binding transcriptional regulator AlpA
MDARLDDRIIAEAPREALPGLIADLARLHALALVRLVQPERPQEHDRLLTAEEAASIAGLTPKQLTARRLPFKRRIGHRTIRFSERGLHAWLRRAS